jgi:peptide/nickel transport system substrate-binding protein
MKKSISLVLTVLITMMLISGCTSNTETGNVPESPAKTNLVVMSAAKAINYDPTVGAQTDPIALHSIFDSLVKFDDNADTIPYLAESWELDSTGLIYTFKLRKDVKFHDGTALTADDVVYTLDTMKANPVYAIMAGWIKSWNKVDDYTITIDRPNGLTNTMNYLAGQVMIIPKGAHSKDPAGFAMNPVGSGAYKFVSIEPDGSTKLESNEAYFLGVPEMKTVTIKAPLDPSAAILSLQTGEIDILTTVNGTQLEQIKNDSKITTIAFNGWSQNGLYLMGERLNNDPNLRQAIVYGVNRQNLIDLAAFGLGTLSQDLFAKRVMGEFEGAAPVTGYNLDMAKEFVAKANDVATPLVLSITPDQAIMAQSIQSDLAALGLEVQIEQLEMNAFYEKLMNKETEMGIMMLGTFQMTVDSFMFYYASYSPFIGNAINQTPEYDALVGQIMMTADGTELRKLCIQALEHVTGMNIQVPLFDTTMMLAQNKTIENISPQSAGTYVFYLGDIKAAK